MRFILGISLVLLAFAPLALSDVFADLFNVNFDKSSYHTGDSLVISGQIVDFGMPVIAMSIFDPAGKILSANNVELSSDGSFSKTIFLDSPFYEIAGEYLIKLDYGKVTEEHNFVIQGTVEAETASQEVIVPEIVSVYTEKDHYFDNNTIKIFGTVSSLDSPTVLIGVHDPFGTPVGFYFGNINDNLEFSASFLAKDGVNFKSEGTYSIKAHYAQTSTKHFFEYSANPPTKSVVEETTESLEDTTKTTVDETTDTVDATKDYVEKTIQEPIQETVPETIEETIETPTKIIEESPEPVKDIIDKEIISKKKIITKEKPVPEKEIISKETQPKNKSKENILENEEHDNLSVEDIELGKLLNQINLECDSSTFVDSISYYDGMGPALYRLCQFDNSLKFFNESLIEDPDNVEALVNKGSTLGKIGHVSESIAYYDRAIVLDPDFLSAKHNKANALATLGNLDDAILLYNEILEENPNYYTARTNLNTALSLKSEIPEPIVEIKMPEPEIENSFKEKPLPEKTIPVENKKEKPTNILEELTRVFSSLFGFVE
nr:tetratricopeptide repeat protein [Nitrosopumilus piranensis]